MLTQTQLCPFPAMPATRSAEPVSSSVKWEPENLEVSQEALRKMISPPLLRFSPRPWCPLPGTSFLLVSGWSRVPWSGLGPHRLWGWQKLCGVGWRGVAQPQPIHFTAGETEAQSRPRAWLPRQLPHRERGIHVLTAHLSPCWRLAQCV